MLTKDTMSIITADALSARSDDHEAIVSDVQVIAVRIEPARERMRWLLLS